MAGAQDGFPSPCELTRIITTKVCKFARGRRIRDDELDDMVQKLWLELLRQMPRFDRSRAAVATFVDRVLESKGVSMMESLATNREKILRHAHRLDEPPRQGDEEELTLAETYSEDDYFRDTRFGSPPQHELIETRIDVESALRSLAPEMRQLAEQLKVMTSADIEKRFNIPHATLHDHIRKLGRVLAAAGLADYAPDPPKKIRRKTRQISGRSGMC